MQTVELAYGRGRLPLQLDPNLADWTVIQPRHAPALPNPRDAFINVCRQPIGAPPLNQIVAPDQRVVIVTSDGTRPVPNRQLIPWLLDELPVPDSQVKIIIGAGSHRANTPHEIEEMFGADIMRRVEIVNHNAYDPDGLKYLGETALGGPIVVNRQYLDADVRIVIGFIEPHFFAGFSGGAKGVIPALAGIDSIYHLHGYKLIADPNSTFGVLENNPVQSEIQQMVRQCPPHFMVNVNLTAQKEINGVFAGDYIEAHLEGCRRVMESSMTPVDGEFPLVVTTNSGYPLDQNLYQTVKGMSAAARIAIPGATIVVASECSDGVPEHGNFFKILQDHKRPEEALNWIAAQPKTVMDQWEAQVMCDILARHRVQIFSNLSPAVVQACQLEPIADVQTAVEERLRRLGNKPKAAVIPEGPISIPFPNGVH